MSHSTAKYPVGQSDFLQKEHPLSMDANLPHMAVGYLVLESRLIDADFRLSCWLKVQPDYTVLEMFLSLTALA